MTLTQFVRNYDDENTENRALLTEDEFCIERGIQIPAKSRFCPRCGARRS